jgi:hypothetical protein
MNATQLSGKRQRRLLARRLREDGDGEAKEGADGHNKERSGPVRELGG